MNVRSVYFAKNLTIYGCCPENKVVTFVKFGTKTGGFMVLTRLGTKTRSTKDKNELMTVDTLTEFEYCFEDVRCISSNFFI